MLIRKTRNMITVIFYGQLILTQLITNNVFYKLYDSHGGLYKEISKAISSGLTQLSFFIVTTINVSCQTTYLNILMMICCRLQIFGYVFCQTLENHSSFLIKYCEMW